MAIDKWNEPRYVEDANKDFWREEADKARWLLKVSQDSVTATLLSGRTIPRHLRHILDRGVNMP